MFLISLLLVSLIAVLIVTDRQSSAIEQEELIPVPVRTDDTRGFKKFD